MSGTRILVTEDDAALAAFLRKGLLMEGYQTDLAATAAEGLQRLAAVPYELLLLDLSLPDLDGIEVLCRVKSDAGSPLVIVLTARTQVEDRIRCLDAGADDLLLKPFSFAELTARSRAALRRRRQASHTLLQAGELKLDRLDRTVLCGKNSVDLTPKEFALLEALMLRRGKCCSREDLLRSVWPFAPSSGANVVDVYINHVRRKLAGAMQGSDASLQPTIQNVRGRGYCVAAPSTSSYTLQARSHAPSA